jgi:hypothetical protein
MASVPIFTEPSMSSAESKSSIHFARPRFGRISTAANYSGISRSRLYEYAAVNAGLFRKNGAAVVVDFDVLDQILDKLPVAKIKPPRIRPMKARPAGTP